MKVVPKLISVETLSTEDDATLRKMKEHAKSVFEYQSLNYGTEAAACATSASSAFALICGEQRARAAMRGQSAPKARK